MQHDRNFIDELKHQYKHGGMFIKLLFVNVIVFLLVHLLLVVGRLSGELSDIKQLLRDIFTLETDLTLFLYRPWGIFTSIFAHFEFMHFLFNMLILFFLGRAFEQFFGGKRLLTVYLVGGIVGGLFEIIAHQIFPAMMNDHMVVLGASGSIMAIFIGLAFAKPNLPLSFFGLVEIRIIYIGLAYLLIDFIRLGSQDGTAHFAHLGGAIVGILAANQAKNPQGIFSRLEKFWGRMKSNISGFSFKKKSPYRTDAKNMTDEEFNRSKKLRQEKTDAILDKISKSGYESLSRAEKEFLFNQSNKN